MTPDDVREALAVIEAGGRSGRSVLRVSNTERLAAFVELADDVLANPWCQRKVEVRLEYQAIDESGRGDWTLHGPTELELKAS